MVVYPEGKLIPMQSSAHNKSIGPSTIQSARGHDVEASFIPAPSQVQKHSMIPRGAMTQRESIPIGPQKSKSQEQANQKDALENSIETDENSNHFISKEEIPREQPEEVVVERKTVAEIFQERIQKWKKDNIKDMALSDQLEFRDPHAVADCAQAIYENMKT